MDKTVWMMVGAPGSGKTWVAKNILMKGLGWRYISRDEIRFSIIKEGDEYFQYEDEVFDTFTQCIRNALNEEGIFNVIADATHLNWPSRRKLLHAIRVPASHIIPVVVENSLNEALSNNNERQGNAKISQSVIRRMYVQTTDPKNDPVKYCGILRINNQRKKEEKK